MDAIRSSNGYRHFSSNVRLELRTAGRSFDLAEISPREITLREPVDLPPCDAEIVMTVDGEPRHWKVRLVNGAVPFDRVMATESR
jgi:hypothetical protein